MGAMFRSEEMALCLLFIQPEAAYLTVSELGESGTVQFRDLNADVNYFQRKFVTEVRRCDEMERKLRYIEAEVKKDGVLIQDDPLQPIPRAPNPREITVLESCIEKTENDILELSQNAVNLKSSFLELMELRHVLEKTQVFLTEEEVSDTMARAMVNEESQNITGDASLEFVAGVINRERMPAFERMLWRISRGNVFLRQASLDKPLEDPTTGNEIYKTVFVAFFQGEQLKTRIRKVCTGFHASLCPCPSSHTKRMEMLKGVRTRLEDLKLVLDQTYDHRMRVLRSVAKELPNWTVMVRKMKAIYHTMNLFNMDVSKKCLIGECWVPMADLQVVQNCLTEGSRLCGNSIASFLNVIHTEEDPPTFNRTNKFTRGFQNLIDAYGVASYRETNPALWSIVTFPFLFAVMFGDAGHGIIVLLFGAYMVLWEKKLQAKKTNNEIWNIFFGGRYIILMMGMFSVYTGLIYNDVFSKSINVLGSNWRIGDKIDFSDVRENKTLMLNPKDTYKDEPYMFGIDPVWMVSENKIMFLNSFKMKLSIIFGVVHMIFGVCMNLFNIVHFKKYASFFLEFLPSLIFLMLMFGYMAALIFAKWILFSSTYDGKYVEGCAPSIIILFVNMILQGHTKVCNPNKPPEECICEEYMYPGQEMAQKIMFVTSLVCVPILLFGKPIHFLLTRNKKKTKNHDSESNGQDIELHQMNGKSSGAGHSGEHEEGENFGEVMMHQAIHTVEYVLSTVSHTASYLRLWALSLAHAQLSEVLWTMVLVEGFKAAEGEYWKAGMLFFVFGAWAILTIAILVLMEGMSAFLHTLRLHWVEFMSKFYGGTGYAFKPFCFKSILEAEEASED